MGGMSVSKSNALASTPEIPGLVSDVTPRLVASLPLPTIRALAKTSRDWARYLEKEWDLHQRNCADAFEKIQKHEYPMLKMIDVADRLAHAKSNAAAKDFLRDSPVTFNSAKTRILTTVLSARIKEPLPKGLQFSLQGNENWEVVGVKATEKIESLVLYCSSIKNKRKVCFEEILEIFADLQDRPKSYAFVHLIHRLCRIQNFHNNLGIFWLHRDDRANDFIFVAKDLLPKKWNPWLADYKVLFFPGFSRATPSFVSAAIISLRQLKRHAPEFGASLLRLVMTSADELPLQYRTWKYIFSNAIGFEKRLEAQALQSLILAVFCWGMPNAQAKEKCKKILAGSGFFSRGDWSRFKHYAPIWAKEMNLSLPKADKRH